MGRPRSSVPSVRSSPSLGIREVPRMEIVVFCGSSMGAVLDCRRYTPVGHRDRNATSSVSYNACSVSSVLGKGVQSFGRDP